MLKVGRMVAKIDLAVSSMVVFLSCFALSFAASSLIIQPQGTKAITGLGLAPPPTMSLGANSSGLELSPVPTANGGLASGSHILTAATNVPTGYNLALVTTSAPSSSLAASSGTLLTPVALSNNTWGYALSGVTVSTSDNSTLNGFDQSYATPTPSAASKWADPTTMANIKNTANSTTALPASATTTVYYGVKVDMSLPSGTYSNTVRYTATANMASIPTPSIISITPSSGSTAGGTAVQIAGTGFAVNDVSVTTTVTVGGAACTGVTISSNTPVTGQDTIYCDTAAHAAGVASVAVATWGGQATLNSGYTYVTPANVTFVSPSLASTIAGTESGPAFTVVGTGFTGATVVTIGGQACTSFELVSDRHILCKGPNSMAGAGVQAVVVTKGNVAGNSSADVTYDSTAYPTLQGSDAYAQCSTTAKLYRDTRDSQLYYVKKMEDNKCWMVDSLKYANYGDLSQVPGKWMTADGTDTLSAANIDVAKYVDPGAGCTDTTDVSANANTRCGLLYTWYAATNGTGTYAQSANGANVAGSICPANFRLPSGTSSNGTATGSGTSFATADFPVLNASMNAGSLAAGNAAASGYYAGWLPTGSWGGALSGFQTNILGNVGTTASYWSSTAMSAQSARHLYFDNGFVSPGPNPNSKYNGSAVRCVMEAP